MALVHVTEVIHEDGLAVLTDAGHQISRGWEGDAVPDGAEAILIRTDQLTATKIEALKALRIISKHGVGCDNIDMAAARARGIPITVTPGANAGSVAEHTIALIFAVARRFGPLDRGLRAGEWPRGGAGIADIAGKRILIVGFGAVGQRVAKMAAALGMVVTVFAPGRSVADGFALATTIEEGLAGAEVLSLHLPLTAATRGLIGEIQLRLLAPGALVINTARGGIVDENALAALCDDGHIGGIGFDVFDGEPVASENPLMTVTNAILTPHTAAMSDGAKRAMAIMAARNVLDGLAGLTDPGMLFQG